MIWQFFIIALAAICKSFSDTLDHHFFTSVFKKLPQKWFNPNVIHKTAPTIFSYPLDAWHISNSIQIGCWLLLPLMYQSIGIDFGRQWINAAVWLCVGGGVFVLVFNLFYNKIFN